MRYDEMMPSYRDWLEHNSTRTCRLICYTVEDMARIGATTKYKARDVISSMGFDAKRVYFTYDTMVKVLNFIRIAESRSPRREG